MGTFGIYLRFFANWKLDECTLALVLKSLYHLLFFALVHLTFPVTLDYNTLLMLVLVFLFFEKKNSQLNAPCTVTCFNVMPGLSFMYGMH